MWSLFMGNTGSSSGSEDEAASSITEKNKTSNIVSSEEEIIKVYDSSRRPYLEEIHVKKHRIPSPTREAGDGMEAATSKSSPNSQQQPVFRETETPSNTLIRLPQTNITVDKLPPILDATLQLPATTPTSPLVPILTGQPLTKNNSVVEFQGSKSSNREPRFVPYEPYKAAVTPLVAKNPKKHSGGRRGSKGTSPPKEINRNSTTSVTNDEETSKESIHEEQQQQEPEEPDSRPAETTSIRENPGGQDEKHERDIRLLREQLSESEKQLRIQTEVNREVKKLLVASVGEDIEAKVDFLTQDKARLAADIRTYSSKMSRDFEEKEKLSVESNLWKSKFLASSVIVDELARGKAALMQRNDDLDYYVRLLLHERGLLWNSLKETYGTVVRLKNAFDPLNALASSSSQDSLKEVEAASVLGLSDLTLKNGKDLRDRLLGSTQLKTYHAGSAAILMPELIDTPAEEGLKKIIQRSAAEDAAYAIGDIASLALTGAARPHLAKLGDRLESPSSRKDFKCCSHCQGSVHIV